MEKLAELFKNKKFLYLFSGFIALIGLIVIIKNRNNDVPENNEIDEIKNQLKEQQKTLKLIKQKNIELEKNSHGKELRNGGKRGETGIESTGKEGKGKTTEKPEPIAPDIEPEDFEQPTE